ncbi:MAG: tRNA (cytosine(32)/uridine(32)-2'-O)-methyltransferase TrmJ [Gammaproteobacteria bacterium]|nr:tRNA (cytosine(32)/uridine(32)-2'-O)-methyltransferase TrmJ [Gammaproteobacteria bacterium]
MTDLDFGNISVVLVNTSHPGNIGASARAMKNMGLSKLVLVRPKEFPSGVATGRAASAVDLLEQAQVVDSLEEAIADCGLVIGASARSRRIPWPLLTPEQCARQALAEVAGNRVALVFGREDTGLSNEELQLCHYHVRIPANSGYSSLNLAAAVLVVCYELHKAALPEEGDEAAAAEREWDQEMSTGEDVERFYEHLERVLVAVDFHDPNNPRHLMHRIRRLFGRTRIDVMEMNILRGMLTHIEKNLKDRDR